MDIRTREEEARMLEVFTQRGRFLARGDGLIQFPIGDLTISVGFSDTNHDARFSTSGKVDVAVLNEQGTFVTAQTIFDALGMVIHDQRVGLTVDEFEDVVLHACIRKMTRKRPGIDAL